ncbi:hypothetical protein H8K38_02385 [Undibacterium sp. FT79W]|uniref:hypothetical protein n=1 Tax=Undibacterium sp. FT79W TaxID=2762296 RepID=UPI00164B0B7B|nr:hypothetical protein [Undibacterium sp. FT79W]MBC3876649.1 hypothetical protein [Undibacterium sp. FT79W]
MNSHIGEPIKATYSSDTSTDSKQEKQHLVAQPYFDTTTVTTRNANGEAVSLYGGDSWDFRSQSLDGSTANTLHFWKAPPQATDHFLCRQIYEQNKALIWVIADQGDLKSPETLSNHNYTARGLCSFAYEKGIDLFGLLTDFELLSTRIDKMHVNQLLNTRALVKALWRYRRQLLPGDAKMNRTKIMETLTDALAELPEGMQTPLIPSRIYCSILGGLLEGLEEIEQNLPVLLDALRATVNTTATLNRNRPSASRQQHKVARGRMLAETFKQMRSLGWKQGPGKTLHTFIFGKVRNYQCHLMHTVVAFSGMRKCEVKLLPLNGVLDTFQHRGREHCLIKGYTHKLHHGDKAQAEWITIDQGHRAIKLAMQIGGVILSLHQQPPQKGQEALLFCSTSTPFKMMEGNAFGTAQDLLIKAICPVITAEDLDELNQLELERGWARKCIEPGLLWPLAMHQLRRSLSVYAHRSGMVSLPALKAQLQHITDEMRVYYSDGWSRAVNLVFEKDHFSHEWNTAKVESTYFGLSVALKTAFDEEDDLLGIGAQQMRQIFSKRSREQTLALIKNGSLAYRETVLGGCISTEECKAMPLDPINFECVESNCANIVVRSKRLDMVIRSQESVVAQVALNDTGSVEHRLESEHLKRMLIARDRLKQINISQETKA